MNKCVSESFWIILLVFSQVSFANNNKEDNAEDYFDKKEKQVLSPLAKPFPAPDFELKDEEGKTHRLSSYLGKVVILNFWTSWCPPCRDEFPSMEKAWQKVKDKGIAILAVNMGEDEDAIFDFTGRYPVTFPMPMDTDGSVIKKYPVIGLPTTYIISPKGMVTHRAVGTREWEHPQLLKQLLKMRK